MFLQRLLTRENLERVERLRPVAAEFGVTLGQLALAWVLHRPEVTGAIAGATKLIHVEENVHASDVELDAGTIERIERAL